MNTLQIAPEFADHIVVTRALLGRLRDLDHFVSATGVDFDGAEWLQGKLQDGQAIF